MIDPPELGAPERMEWGYQMALATVRAAENNKPLPDMADEFKAAQGYLYSKYLIKDSDRDPRIQAVRRQSRKGNP
jgi:hypothetical protein